MSKTLKGVFPALPTPFREDLSVDYAALKRVVEFAISAGAHGLLAVDMPGEFFTLTDDERRNCVEVILETVADRVPVAVNVSAASEEQSFLFAKHKQKTMNVQKWNTHGNKSMQTEYITSLYDSAPHL